MASALSGLVLIASCAIMFADSAYAYLDPGTGSVILQVVAAAVLGALFTIKSYWHALAAFFSGKKKKKVGNHDDQHENKS